MLDFGGRFFRVAYVNIKKSETILDNEAHELLEKRRARNRTLSIAPSKTQSEKLVETVASVGEHEGMIYDVMNRDVTTPFQKHNFR